MLFLDGIYLVSENSARPRFQWVRGPTSAQLTQLAHNIACRVERLVEREGLLERDTEQLDLGEVLDPDDPMPDLAGHSISYRIAVGPHRGRKSPNTRSRKTTYHDVESILQPAILIVADRTK